MSAVLIIWFRLLLILLCFPRQLARLQAMAAAHFLKGFGFGQLWVWGFFERVFVSTPFCTPLLALPGGFWSTQKSRPDMYRGMCRRICDVWREFAHFAQNALLVFSENACKVGKTLCKQLPTARKKGSEASTQITSNCGPYI